MPNSVPGNRRRSPVSVTGRPGNRQPGALDNAVVRSSAIAAVRIEQASDASAQAEAVQSVQSGLNAISLSDPTTLQATLDHFAARLTALEP